MEQRLYEWSKDLERKGVPITARMVKAKAMELRPPSRDFIPNKAWIEKFKLKFDLNLVKETP